MTPPPTNPWGAGLLQKAHLDVWVWVICHLSEVLTLMHGVPMWCRAIWPSGVCSCPRTDWGEVWESLALQSEGATWAAEAGAATFLGASLPPHILERSHGVL